MSLHAETTPSKESSDDDGGRDIPQVRRVRAGEPEPKPEPDPEAEYMVESTIACEAMQSMGAERHGAASAVVLQVWSDAPDAHFVVTSRVENGTTCAAGYMAYRVVGRDGAGDAGAVCFISDLYVRPSFRRRGIARRMLRRLTQPHRGGEGTTRAESDALPSRWGTVQLHVICNNEPAVQLYLSEGFNQFPVGADVAWEERDKRVMEFKCL